MLKGKNAVITGSNRGIGRATVELFAENGANIWACAREKNPVFESDMKELAERCGVWVRPVYFDMADREAVTKGADDILREKLPVDVLVNNAGVTATALLMQTSIEEIERVFSINFFSQLLLTQKLMKRMIRQKSGAIINIASVKGLDAKAGCMTYATSKAALIMATRVLAEELSSFGVRVNAVAPGSISTDMHDEKETSEILEKIRSKSFLARLGEPEEIAWAILYLASDISSYVNGQVIRVDGGFF
ncbi:MAG: SDR family oxidoreductase [Oscillospiraceae bacterium]|nr:SDR family oxidoreductase [Oscillospiraceae bacterium]